MDGNGRWAHQHGLHRSQGHVEGLKTAKKIVKAASAYGIRFLSLYVFSTENWKRELQEINAIMSLIRRYLRVEMPFYLEHNLRIRYAGDKSALAPDIAAIVDEVCDKTRSLPGMHVVLALNYGGRNEIVRSVQKLVALNQPITENSIHAYLDNPDIPDPDLIIRTSGEWRSSNFLLWESAYTEYMISDTLWPDWTEKDFNNALDNFQKRKRRFGGV
jgi:undecaprenyl diphosphate synthase